MALLLVVCVGFSPAASAQDLYTEMSGDVQSDAQIVDQYWQQHWSDFFTGSYRSPQLYGVYTAADAPSCGGQVEETLNAHYCKSGDFLDFSADLLAIGYRRRTNAWTALIVAHEWGHAIQARLSKELQSPAAELQADCFAGAELYGAAQDGLGQFEAGDESAIVDSLNFAADQTPWTKPSDHGDAFQRVNAFAHGRSGGVMACVS
jgi:predicted metalloprotease